MSCTANHADPNCDGCRHCGSVPLQPGERTSVVHNSDIYAGPLRRIAEGERQGEVRRSLIRNRHNN